MNSMIKRISKKPLLQGILAAILVFVGGFGVMCLMYHHWLQTDSMNYPELKGLFDYKASLFGDSICLPAIVGSGTAYCSFFKRKIGLNRNERNLSLIIGCIGGAIGLLIQAKWVISDNTVCNWSIPTKHHFNYAGWYHAVFFILIFFIVSYISTSLILIDVKLKKSDNNDYLIKEPDKNYYIICQYITWFFGILFLHFHYLDDYSDRFSEETIICFISILVMSVLLIIKCIIYRTKTNEVYTPVIFSAVTCTLVSLISIHGSPKCDKLLLLSGILVTSLFLYNSNNRLKMIGIFLIYALFYYLCQIIISENVVKINNNDVLWINPTIIFCMLLCCFVPFTVSAFNYIFFEKSSVYDNNKHIQELVFAMLISAIIQVLSYSDRALSFREWGDKLAQVSGTSMGIGSFAIFVLISQYIKTTFDRIKRVEYRLSYPSTDKLAIKNIHFFKISQYIVYLFAYFAAIVLIWTTFSVSRGNYGLYINWISLPIGVVLVCLILYLAMGRKTKLYYMMSCVSYILIFIHLFSTSMLLYSNSIEGWQWIKVLLVFYFTCATSVFSVISMLYNIDLLRFRSIQIETIIISSMVAILGSTCYGLAAYQLLIFRTQFHVIQLFFTTLLSFCLLPALQAKRLNPIDQVGILDNSPAAGVMQDGFLFGIVMTSNMFITMWILEFVFNQEFLTASSVFLGYSTGLYCLWNYCIQNNINHFSENEKNAKQVIEKREDCINQVKNLKVWLSMQNIYAVLLALPYSLFFIVIKWTMSDNEKLLP